MEPEQAAPQPGVSVEGGRNLGANSTTQQANKVKKWGFRSAESRGPQSLPDSIGPTMSSALGTSNGFVTICNPSLMGDSTGESPQGRAVWETAFPLPKQPWEGAPPCHSASMHGQGLVTTGSILLGRGPCSTMFQQPVCPQGQADPGLYNPYQ